MSSSWFPAIAIAFLLFLALPTARVHAFDGLPLSGLAEFAALFLMLPLCVSGALRRLHARWVEAWLERGRLPLVAAVLLLAIGAKLLLLIAGDRPGFAACYQSVVDANPAGLTCERSYENLLFRDGVTRIDDTITFEPATWNLSFFNSNRFNFYSWENGNVERSRMPFAARWRGEIDHSTPTTIALTYVGQGTVRVGSAAAVALPPAYHRPETITLTAPAGRQTLALEYRFDDGSRVGDGPAVLRGPYASLNVRAGGTPLRPIDPATIWRVVGGFVDLAIVMFLGSVVWCYGRLLRHDIGLTAIACVGGALLAIDPTVTMRSVRLLGSLGELPPGLPRGIGLTLVASALFVPILWRPSTRRLLLAYLAIGWASAFRQDFFLHGFHAVLYRGPGSDWLTYESFARAILETGSLEAGEPVFFYQPFFRYILFLSHAVLGDGDTLIALLAQTLLIWSVFWMSARLLPRGLARDTPRTAGIAVGLLLIALATSDPVSWMIHEGASEYPTWIAFLLLFTCLFASRSMRLWWLGATMVGLSLITRLNHAIALGWMYAIFLGRAAKVRPAFAVRWILLLALIGALPVAHNAYYGRALSLLPGEHALEQTLPMPPSRWLRVFHDDEARTQALVQLSAVTYARNFPTGSMVVTDASHVVMSIVFHGLQVAWVAAGILLLRIPAGATATLQTARLLWILPFLYLCVHLFYQARDGHPRFIVSGYFAMGAVAMLALRERALSRRLSAGRTPAG